MVMAFPTRSFELPLTISITRRVPPFLTTSPSRVPSLQPRLSTLFDMSSPIAIPRPQAPTAVVTSLSSSASSTSSSSLSLGKYVPVHKRVGATPTPSTPSSDERSRSPRGRRGRLSRNTSAVADYEHNHSDIPIHTSIPNIYTITDLLAFSTTAPASLSPNQLASLTELLPFTYAPAAPTSGGRRARRVGTAAAKKAAPRPIANAPEDVHEQRRKQHSHTWGWHPVVHLEETWRHPVAVQV